MVGGGKEAYRKLQSILDSDATIWVISRDFSDELQLLYSQKRVVLLKTEIKNAQKFIDSLNPKPYLLLAVTNDSALNLNLIKAASSYGCIVYSVDNPSLSDFILPAVAHIGDVKIAVSTSGKSPAMARILRERIEKVITAEDLLEIELQGILRKTLKNKIHDPKLRRKILYTAISSREIKKALSEGKLAEAETTAMKLITNMENKI